MEIKGIKNDRLTASRCNAAKLKHQFPIVIINRFVFHYCAKYKQLKNLQSDRTSYASQISANLEAADIMSVGFLIGWNFVANILNAI